MKNSLGYVAGVVGLVGGSAAIMVACGGGDKPATDDMGTTMTSKDVTAADVKGGNTFQYVLNSLLLPMSRTDYAIDLNGDGNKDNQLGNIIGALSAQNLDAQKGVDDSVLGGSVILLASVTTADATVKSDPGVETDIYLGTAIKGMITDGGVIGGPDFTGAGMFTVDASQSPAKFFGKLSGGKFTSNNPVTTTAPVKITLKLALIAGESPVSLALNGAQIQYTADATGLMTGELHGSLKSADINTSIIPAVATLLTKQIAKNPDTASTKQIESIFDTGGKNGMCTNPDNTMAKAGDGIISICEVAENSIIENVLAPDVQIYSADGATYAPNKANTKKDSLSFGVGFTAVKAKFPAQ